VASPDSAERVVRFDFVELTGVRSQLPRTRQARARRAQHCGSPLRGARRLLRAVAVLVQPARAGRILALLPRHVLRGCLRARGRARAGQLTVAPLGLGPEVYELDDCLSGYANVLPRD